MAILAVQKEGKGEGERKVVGVSLEYIEFDRARNREVDIEKSRDWVFGNNRLETQMVLTGEVQFVVFVVLHILTVLALVVLIVATWQVVVG